MLIVPLSPLPHLTAGINFAVGLRVVSEDDAAQLQNVLNESASTGSQARMTARRRGRARQKARGVQCDAAELVCANLSCVRHVGF